MGAEVGCLYSEGPWVFVGLTNEVKALNIQTHAMLSLSVPFGFVYAIEVEYDMLFAGAQDGAIYEWKLNNGANSFEPITSLIGHSGAVVSLVVGDGKLYSGSMDNTVRRWDLKTLQCIQTLTGHTQAVASVLCWDAYLLTSSLDRKLKFWAATEDWSLVEYHTHEESRGIQPLCGMHDAEGKPILLSSCNDNSVRLLELPSLREVGRIYARKEIRTIRTGPGVLFFIGYESGHISVWKSLEKH